MPRSAERFVEPGAGVVGGGVADRGELALREDAEAGEVEAAAGAEGGARIVVARGRDRVADVVAALGDAPVEDVPGELGVALLLDGDGAPELADALVRRRGRLARGGGRGSTFAETAVGPALEGETG